jgi:hypothetical protein
MFGASISAAQVFEWPSLLTVDLGGASLEGSSADFAKLIAAKIKPE